MPTTRDSVTDRRARILASPQYTSGAFRNPSGLGPRLQAGSTWPVMRDFLFVRGERRPPAPLPTVDPREGWARPPSTGLRVTWLGHSTMVVEIDGVRLLTDPVWGERVSPIPFAGPRRFQPVPVAISALPPLDVVLLTHDHFDHLDKPTIAALAPTSVPFVTSLGVGARLEAWGIAPARITELDWWESTEVVGASGASIRMTAGPAQHFSGRGITDRNQTLWSSFALRGPERSMFYSGDTGLIPEYADIGARLGPFDMVALEVGAHHPAWGTIHLGPDNAVEAWRMLGSGAFLPVHWGAFDLALHDWHEPIERLVAIAAASPFPLLTPRIGEPFEPLMAREIEPWWRPSMRRATSL
jgi:L-ascorbate metabolism protein UlaG (beta-lactamase superfamily)